MDGSGVESEEAPEGFGARVRSALAWRWGSQFAAQLIAWGSTIIVVRLLDPSDYGLFAMSQVVIVALNFLNGWSFATSLIQADEVGEREIGQVFALLLMMNGILAIAQFLFAPIAAEYYREPAVAVLLRVQALIFLTTPFIALPTAMLARALEFRKQGVSNLVAAVVGAVTALALAWFGFGVWALVYAPILAFATRGLMLTIVSRVLPKPVFDFRGAGALIGFGGILTLCQLFWIVQSQSDIVIAGRVFDTHDLGIYSEALFLTLIVSGRFLPPVNEVAFPAYAELHKAGRRLAPYFEKTVRTVMLVTAPVYIGMALTAPEAILTVFGEKWSEMAPIVAGLALAMPLMCLQIVCSPATNAMGNTRPYLTTSVAGAVIFPLAFYFGIRGGPQGLVHAWWVAAPALLLVTLYLTLPAVRLPVSRLIAAASPALLSCAAMAIAVTGVRALLPNDLHYAAVLAALVLTGVATYTFMLLVFWRDVVREGVAMLRNRPVIISPGKAAPTPGQL